MLLGGHSSSLCCVVFGVATYAILHSGASISKSTFIVKCTTIMPQLECSMLRAVKTGGSCSRILMHKIVNKNVRYFCSGRNESVKKDGGIHGK